MSRLKRRFAQLARQDRAGLITFITAGDPDLERSQDLLDGLPEAGADIIELGMAFSDPMADGPTIQASSQRALAAGASLKTTLQMVRNFRKQDAETPIILMGYFNPIYIYGVSSFLADAKTAGVDGFIVVDLPPEEEEEFCLPCLEAGLSFIYLATPTTNEARLARILENAGGFVYYVSIAGITGAGSASEDHIKAAVAGLRAQTDLPIAVGFGVKTPAQAAEVARIADAVVVGSAIVDLVGANADSGDPAVAALDLTGELAKAVREAREGAHKQRDAMS